MSTHPLIDRVTIEPGKCGGRPCIRGLRLRVRDVLDLLSNGASHAEILEDFPELEEDDIRGSAGLGGCAGKPPRAFGRLNMAESSSGALGRVLLVDNQLPAALARHLDATGHPSLHVRDIGLADADDRAIWAYAKTREWTIVTKDEDFQDLSIRFGSPPQVVWVRLGNCRKQALFQVFDQQIENINAALTSGESMVELRG